MEEGFADLLNLKISLLNDQCTIVILVKQEHTSKPQTDLLPRSFIIKLNFMEHLRNEREQLNINRMNNFT